MRMGDGTFRAAPPARRAAGGVSTLLAVGLALAASPALSQGAMGPGGGAMTPQPRVAPQAPVAPPQAPVLAPTPVVPQPGIQPGAVPQSGRVTTPQIPAQQKDGIVNQSGPVVATEIRKDGDRLIQTTNSVRTTTAPTGPANPVANNSNNPIPSVNVMVRKQSGAGAISTAKTDGSGQTTFRQLEPGTYDVALPSVPGGTVSMTTFVNGTPVARTDFPAGSEIGTFTVAKASDTVILKFQTNLGTTPVNGIGGTGAADLRRDQRRRRYGRGKVHLQVTRGVGSQLTTFLAACNRGGWHYEESERSLA